MKKTLLVLTFACLLAVLLSATTTTASAGGWFKASASDPIGTDLWSTLNTLTATASTPHRGFSTTSNRCKTCHAVHDGGNTSWRLLKSGNTTEARSPGELTGAANVGMGNKRSTECMYCHDADSGVTSKKPYGLLFSKTVRGEHTLGATWIPDSSVNDASSPADGKGVLRRKEIGAADAILDCYQCHTVHGAKRLTNITAFAWGSTEPIDNYILRDDPAGNGGNANDGINSILPPWDSSATTNKWKDNRSKDTTTFPSKDTPYYEQSVWKYEVQAAWCGDCHNENPNITGPGDFRPNGGSHALFGGLDSDDASNLVYGGYMDVDGVVIKVAGSAPKGCAQCHMSGTGADDSSTLSWPHQAEGIKMLGYNATDHPVNQEIYPVDGGTSVSVSGVLGDSNRVVPNMDRACIWCHEWKKTGIPEGVGRTF